MSYRESWAKKIAPEVALFLSLKLWCYFLDRGGCGGVADASHKTRTAEERTRRANAYRRCLMLR